MSGKTKTAKEKKTKTKIRLASGIKTLNADKFKASWFNPSRSVGAKMFLFIFVSILVCVLVVGMLAYNTSKSIIRTNAMNSSFQTIQQAGGKLGLMFENYEALTLQVMVDAEIQEQLRIIQDPAVEQYEGFQATQKLNSLLQKYVLSNSSITNGYLIPLKEGEYALGSSAFDSKKAHESPWYKRMVGGDGQAVWIETQPKGLNGYIPEPTIGVGRLLKNTTTNQALFAIVFEIKLSSVEEALGNISLGDGSTVALVDDKNQYISYIGEDAAEKYGKPSDTTIPNSGEEAKSGSVEVDDAAGASVLAAYESFNTSGWRIVGKTPVDQLVKDANAIFVMTFIVTAIAAVAAVGISYMLIRMFARPLVQLRNLMNEGERGNLSVRLHLKRSDEIGQLTDSFNRMMTEITSLVDQTNVSAKDVLDTASELTEASRKTAVASKEISVATEEIAGGATSLAMEAERGNDLTATINTQMKTVMSANNSMEQSAAAVEQASEQGTLHMNSLIQKTGETEEMTRNMVSKVDKLKDSTSSIRKILDVLNNITKQTNILSLNATIEAARAGAAGKGFMVVADEIRKLADQSRQSIDVVGQITETIQKEIDETVDVLSEAYPIFQEQVASVKESNQIFLTVQGHMSRFGESLGSVTEAIGKLDESQNVLTDAMSSVSAVAQQSSATSEEVASLSTEQLSISEGLVRLSNRLEDVSNKLKESLSKFTTSNH
ncbi:methyl-accepting chemotaxis sensory transducer [Paenibacillus curdlanolyticus YK9]|uniref:Methyl-accepting chemotaxis sensory transducer n=1 Tax=Paenibacillus curdlanolyticus YK9 TaxID=717606 RepID=E0IE12_9BACL|nr:methyl-accepting chemotaxis protein [Paenibacillus curdlanolyticus]EFM09366.1 methyl-accepting chemotaxis sensory transducer [Paenibacillus curdlanolyticus YK9]